MTYEQHRTTIERDVVRRPQAGGQCSTSPPSGPVALAILELVILGIVRSPRRSEAV